MAENNTEKHGEQEGKLEYSSKLWMEEIINRE